MLEAAARGIASRSWSGRRSGGWRLVRRWRCEGILALWPVVETGFLLWHGEPRENYTVRTENPASLGAILTSKRHAGKDFAVCPPRHRPNHENLPTGLGHEVDGGGARD